MDRGPCLRIWLLWILRLGAHASGPMDRGSMYGPGRCGSFDWGSHLGDLRLGAPMDYGFGRCGCFAWGPRSGRMYTDVASVEPWTPGAKLYGPSRCGSVDWGPRLGAHVYRVDHCGGPICLRIWLLWCFDWALTARGPALVYGCGRWDPSIGRLCIRSWPLWILGLGAYGSQPCIQMLPHWILRLGTRGSEIRRSEVQACGFGRCGSFHWGPTAREPCIQIWPVWILRLGAHGSGSHVYGCDRCGSSSWAPTDRGHVRGFGRCGSFDWGPTIRGSRGSGALEPMVRRGLLWIFRLGPTAWGPMSTDGAAVDHPLPRAPSQSYCATP